MRKQTRKFIISPLPLFVLLMAMGACTDKIGDPKDTPETGITKEIIDSPVDMIAGQNMVIGQCSWVVEEEGLHVFIALDEPWLLEEVHIDIADVAANLHRNRGGNLVPGQFDYVFPEIFDAYFDFIIPNDVFEGLCEDPFVMAVHAAVFMEAECPEGEEPPCYQYETAWANGTQTGRNWGMYVETDPGCYDEQGDPGETLYEYHTSYAYGGDDDMCFLNYGFNRWGWVLCLPGGDPFNETSFGSTYYTNYDIWASAGQCILENGFDAGQVGFMYEDGMLTFQYQCDWENYPGSIFTAIHIYVGNAMFPTLPNGNPTVSPGSYGNIWEFEPEELVSSYTDVIEVPNPELGFYIIAHAVVGIPYFE